MTSIFSSQRKKCFEILGGVSVLYLQGAGQPLRPAVGRRSEGTADDHEQEGCWCPWHCSTAAAGQLCKASARTPGCRLWRFSTQSCCPALACHGGRFPGMQLPHSFAASGAKHSAPVSAPLCVPRSPGAAPARTRRAVCVLSAL